jgi:hypothetical protein
MTSALIRDGSSTTTRSLLIAVPGLGESLKAAGRGCLLVLLRLAYLGVTNALAAAWVTQAVRNLAMNLQDAGCRARFLIRDRDGKCPTLFDTILADTRHPGHHHRRGCPA